MNESSYYKSEKDDGENVQQFCLSHYFDTKVSQN